MYDFQPDVTLLSSKHCVIGEGPIWNEREQRLYFTNAMGHEICTLDLQTHQLTVRPVDPSVSAIAFDDRGSILVSRPDGVFRLIGEEWAPLYDPKKYPIQFANDMKVGPDGRLYVGTQSEKRRGISDRVDGRLYSIDAAGNVRILLEGLILSNGMDWSMDESRFYHTDSATRIIREYCFDKRTGDIEATGRSVHVPGVDGFAMDRNDKLHIACWGRSHIAVVDTHTMTIESYISLPAQKPASCAFAGHDMDVLVAVTASFHSDLQEDPHAGNTFAIRHPVGGRKPFLFKTNVTNG